MLDTGRGGRGRGNNPCLFVGRGRLGGPWLLAGEGGRPGGNTLENVVGATVATDFGFFRPYAPPLKGTGVVGGIMQGVRSCCLTSIGFGLGSVWGRSVHHNIKYEWLLM